jgi:NAD(P)-dependent dehydrogenase (short-subunit alcohol dehydrogenase family)
MEPNKIIIVGGTGGIGHQVVTEMQAYPQYAPPLVLGKSNYDLTQIDQVQALVNREQPQILLIMAVYNHNSLLHQYAKTPEKKTHLTQQLRTNIEGVTNLITEALLCMRQKNYGRIILCSSVVVKHRVIGTGIYAACKAYYEDLVKTIALENAGFGITANCIRLGYCSAGLWQTIPETNQLQIIEKIPAQRTALPSEIMSTINLLIKTEYINGTTIELSGGL